MMTPDLDESDDQAQTSQLSPWRILVGAILLVGVVVALVGAYLHFKVPERAIASVDITAGQAPLKVTFTPLKANNRYEWDFKDGKAYSTFGQLPVTHTFTKAGLHDVTLSTVTPPAGRRYTLSFTISVLPGAASRVKVDDLVAPVGTSATIVAHLADQFGNPVEGGKISYQSLGRAGVLRSDGLLNTGSTVGIYNEEIIATTTINGLAISDTATVTLVPGPISRVVVNPDYAMLKPSQQYHFIATALDAYDNVIPLGSETVVWQAQESIGTITNSGDLVTSSSVGNSPRGVVATVSIAGVSATGAAEVTVANNPNGSTNRIKMTNTATLRVIGDNLAFPSSLVTDSFGRILFGELKTGNIDMIMDSPTEQSSPVTIGRVPLPDLAEEQGLWQLALNPEETFLYAMATRQSSPPRSWVVRFPYKKGALGEMQTVLGDLPSGLAHNGGALTFSDDGYLFVSIGDTSCCGNEVQDYSNGFGLILRVTSEGRVPSDNPIPGSPVYAYGFRNSYGLAFHPIIRSLYGTDNGYVCCDRLYRIEPGGFHGFNIYALEPNDFVNATNKVVTPLLNSGNITVAPTQMIVYRGDKYDGAFKGSLVYGLDGVANDVKLGIVRLSRDGNAVVSECVVGFPEENKKRAPLGIIGVAEGPNGDSLRFKSEVDLCNKYY